MKQKFEKLLNTADDVIVDTALNEFVINACGDDKSASYAAAGNSEQIMIALTRIIESLTMDYDPESNYEFGDIIGMLIEQYAFDCVNRTCHPEKYQNDVSDSGKARS